MRKNNRGASIFKNAVSDLRARRNLGKCINVFSKFSNDPFFKVQALYSLAITYRIIGDFKRCTDTLDKLSGIDPSYKTLKEIVYLYLMVGDIDKMNYYIDKLVDGNEKDYMRAKVFYHMNEFDKSIDHIKKLRFTLQEDQGNILLGKIYQLTGDITKAKDIFINLLKSSKKEESLILLMDMLAGKGDEVYKYIKQYEWLDKHNDSFKKEYNRCIAYLNFLDGKLSRKDSRSYYEKQLCSYSEYQAVKHILYMHNLDLQKMSFAIKDEIQIKNLLHDAVSLLDVPRISNTVDKYVIDLPYDVGEIDKYTTNSLEVVTLPKQKKVLTLYPIVNYNKKEK